MAKRNRAGLIALIVLAGCSPLPAQQYAISTFAGGGFAPTPATGTNYYIGNEANIAADAAGNVYFVNLNCAFKLDKNDILTRVAGTGAGGYSGDGGPATSARLFGPTGIAVDSSGNLYIADTTNDRIRRVTPSGIITTVAGNGKVGYAGDGGPAVSTSLTIPGGVAVDKSGNLFIFDNTRIRKVSTTGIITTVAGNGTRGFSGDGGPATQAQFTPARGIAVDSSGNIYIGDTSNNRVRKISAADGTISTFAGGGSVSQDNGAPATQAQLNLPMGIAVDSADNVYMAEATSIQFVNSSGIINAAPGAAGPVGTDPLLGIGSIAVDASGNVYAADVTYRIRRISPAGVITTVAGPSGTASYPANTPPAALVLSNPSGVAMDNSGNLLIADTNDSFLWRVANGASTIIGAPTKPAAVTVDANGNYYAVSNNEVWKAHFTGPAPPEPIIVAGGGSSTAENVPATSALLKYPNGIAVDGSGNLFITDLIACKVFKVTPAGIITTFAGNGTPGFSGDGGPASSAQLDNPAGLAVDTAGNVYIADNFRIRKVSTSGVITTVAGGGTVMGDGGPAINAIVDLPVGVAVDSSGNMYIADLGYQRIRKVTTDGIINTIAGNGTAGYTGDGGFATSATMNQPVGVAVDSAGNVYVAEQTNNVVRLLRPANAAVLISAVLDAATETATPLTPGKIVAIYGVGLGPAAIAVNSPSNGVFGTQIGGTGVTFNGVSAPMIYASATQASAIVPYEVAGAANAQVVVTSPGGVSSTFSVPVATAAPSFFSLNGTGAGQIAAVNLSGIPNDAAHPVAIGGYVSLYATGEGQTYPAGVDGALATNVYPKPVLPVSLTIGGIPVAPAYAGAAPTEVLGLMQIVAQIPPGVQPGGYVPVELQVGTGATVGGATWIAVSAN